MRVALLWLRLWARLFQVAPRPLGSEVYGLAAAERGLHGLVAAAVFRLRLWRFGSMGRLGGSHSKLQQVRLLWQRVGAKR